MRKDNSEHDARVQSILDKLQVEEERLSRYIRVDISAFKDQFAEPVPLPLFSHNQKLSFLKPVRFLVNGMLAPLRYLIKYFARNQEEAFKRLCDELKDLKIRNHEIHTALLKLKQRKP